LIEEVLRIVMVRRLGHVTRHPFLDDGGEQRAAQREYEKTRLAHAAALQERNVNEWRFGWNPKQPEVGWREYLRALYVA
jgi:hypothetical protein